MKSIRGYLCLICTFALILAAISYFQRQIVIVRNEIALMGNEGIEITMTRPEGSVLYSEVPGTIGVRSADGLDVNSWTSHLNYVFHVSIHKKIIRNEDLVRLPCPVTDLELVECKFEGVPRIPATVRSCFFEDSSDADNVLLLLEGLCNTDVRYLELTLHSRKAVTVGLIERIQRLKTLEVLDFTYGTEWFDRSSYGQLAILPNLVIAHVPSFFLTHIERSSADDTSCDDQQCLREDL